MRILFITLLNIKNVDSHDIYSDIVRSFAKKNCEVYVISPVERRFKEKTNLVVNADAEDWHKNIHILRLKIGNIQKTNLIEKGISTLTIEGKLKRGIKKYFRDIKFDKVIYSTPPITLTKPIKFVKKRDHAQTYLMLKDIFPQNSLDLGILSKKGFKGLIYKYFRKKESKLYSLSDRIGCMSDANIEYLLVNNPEIDLTKVELFPNCVDLERIPEKKIESSIIKAKYGIPNDKKIFIYGGNLGKPQCIPFVIECLKKVNKIHDAIFLIVGNGTEFKKLEQYKSDSNQENFILMNYMPKENFIDLLSISDVGLIFLDNRFTIPNFPSRFLSYLEAGIPVLACTDIATDLGKIILDNKLGWWCRSDDPTSFYNEVNKAIINKENYSFRVKQFIKNNYDVAKYISKILE